MTIEMYTSYEMCEDKTKYKPMSVYKTENEKLALAKSVDDRDFYIRVSTGYLPIHSDQYTLLNERSNLDNFSSFVKVEKNSYSLYLNYISRPTSGNYYAAADSLNVN